MHSFVLFSICKDKVLTHEQKRVHHLVGKHPHCPPSVVETLLGSCIWGFSGLWPPRIHCSVYRKAQMWLATWRGEEGLKLQLAGVSPGDTYLQAIFGLHLLQLLLSQGFFIFFGESRAFKKYRVKLNLPLQNPFLLMSWLKSHIEPLF